METIEQAANKYSSDNERCLNASGQTDYGRIRRAFITGAEWQKQQSPWISVEERLPCADELVLCQMGSNYAIVSGYIFINEAGNPQVATDPSFEFEDYNDYKPVKWMSIPPY